MSNSKLTYISALNAAGAQSASSPPRELWRRVPLSFVLIVILPTLLAAIYYLAIATPAYISETRFVIRQASREQPSPLGFALQGVGISSTQTDAFSVHEYMKSRDAATDLGRETNLATILDHPGVDPISRFPRPWERPTIDKLHESLKRFVTVTYDSTTGISTLRVKAFRPQDARQMANVLLNGGEKLINQLNERANEGAIREATRTLADAETRLTEAQIKLTNFRNQERIIDPARTAVESSTLIGGLMSEVARMRAERAQLARSTPQSPQLELIDGRISAYEAQIEVERTKTVGTAQSLAPKIASYESLALNREYAERSVATARSALDNSQNEARRQKLYLDRIISPNLPTDSSEPRRLRHILTIFLSLLIAYGVGWLVVAGVREHQQG